MLKNKNINFIKISKYAMIVYGAIIVIGIVMLCIFGLQLDINFSGGTRFTYTYKGDINIDEAQTIIESQLSGKTVDVTTSEGLNSETKKLVVNLASEEAVDVEVQSNILSSLQEKFKDNDIKLGDSNSVNPTIAGAFLAKSLFAIAIASVLMLIYVGLRFRKIGGISAGITALVALVLDSLMAFFTCVIFRLDIDTNFIAVILTLLGYALNDTIVIYDRIRENNRLMPDADIKEKVNTSINQCLGRSIMTSLSTFIAIMAVVVVSEFFGLSTLRSFAIPMAVGIVSGCCTTLFIAVPLWYFWKSKPKKDKNAKNKSKSNRAKTAKA